MNYRSLIDTGSELTLLNERIYDSLMYKPMIIKDKLTLHSANGSDMTVLGRINLDFKIQGLKFNHNFVVVRDLTRNVILGRDFLIENGARLYFDLNKIRIRNVYIPMENDVHLASKVRASHHMTLAPQTASIMIAEIKKSEYFSDLKDYNFNPTQQGFINEQHELIISPALVKLEQHKFPVQILNIANRTIKIDKGCMLGKLTNISNPALTNREILTIEISDIEFKKQINVLESIRTRVEIFLIKNKTVFAFRDKDLPGTDLGIAEIDTGTHEPISMRPYRIPLGQREIVSEKIDELLEADLICRSNSPWNFPIVLVEKKPDIPGGLPQKRMCVDFRALNQIVHIRSFPLPLIDDILASLKGTTYFTTLDMRSGYHQIPLTKEASDKCAFSCFRGKFKYKVLPYGLKNSGNEFQRMVSALLEGLEGFAMAYVDDILIYTKNSLEDHLKHVQIVIDRLNEHKLRLKLSKCQWAMKSIKYLGFIVNEHGVAPCGEKVKAIKSLKPPTNVKQTRGFVGMLSFYRKFIPRFAEISEPLVALTKKYAHFRWSEKCQKAFEELKEQLTLVPMLAYPDVNEDYILYTDASDEAVGAVLVQKAPEGEMWIDGVYHEKPIYFLSHRLSKSQIKSYSTIEKELFAIHYALNKLHFYLCNARFTIKTDHQPLKYLFSAEQKNRRVQLWAMTINSYNCNIEYLKGSSNLTADLLSRSPPPTDSLSGSGDEIQEKRGSFEVAVLNSNKFNPGDYIRVDLDKSRVSEEEEHDNFEPLVDFDIVSEQEKDEVIKETKRKLLSKRNDAPLLRKFMLKDNVVYYIAHVEDDPVLRLYIPVQLKDKIIKQYHDDNGHMCAQKTYMTIRERYYWPNLYKELEEVIDKCIICKQHSLKQQKAPIQTTGISPYPMAVLQLDLSGPYRKTLSGNLYIATFICTYSGWLECFSLPDKTAQSVLECLLEDVIPRHSCCLAITTDNGTEFNNQYFIDTLKKFNIKHIRTSTYNPQANSVCERSHSTLHSILAKLMRDQTDTWDLYLNAALMAIRTNVSKTTMMSPFKILYNRDAVLPLDSLLMPKEKTHSENYHELAYQNIHKIFMDVMKNTQGAKDKRNKMINKNRKVVTLKVGDPVFLKNYKKANKLDHNWLSHYTIVEQSGPVSFKIRHQLTGAITRVHANALRLANVAWKKPVVTGKTVRKTRLVTSSVDSDSPDEEDLSPMEDLEITNNDESNSDSEKTIIYNPDEWQNEREDRARKIRENTESEGVIPEFELRKRARVGSSNEQCSESSVEEMDVELVSNNKS